MKIQNNVSFGRGRIVPGTRMEGMQHLLTEKVMHVIEDAPDGTELYLSKITGTDKGRIGFSTRESKGIDIAGIEAQITSLDESSVLSVIGEGMTRMGNGVTRSWLIG